MTDCGKTGLPAGSDDVLASFHAKVASLTRLSQEAFAALDPYALGPLVATIRARSSEVPVS